MTVRNEDVIHVHDTPANLTANLKDKMGGYDITNNRFAEKIAGGTMKFVSDDTQQCLLDTIQTLTDIKSFSKVLKALAGIDLTTVFSTKSTSQTISTDNDTLLSVAATSFLRVTTGTTIQAERTVGMEAGARDGHQVTIIIDDVTGGDVLEINDTVPTSALIQAKNLTMPLIIQANNASIPHARTFIWNDSESSWYEI